MTRIARVALLLLLACSTVPGNLAAQVDEDIASGAGGAHANPRQDLERCLIRRDAGALRRWYGERSAALVDGLRLRLARWVRARAGRTSTAAERTEQDVGFVLETLGVDTLPWLARVRDWDRSVCTRFDELHRDLTVLEARDADTDAAWADALETLFFEAQDLEALPLLAARFAHLAYQASGANHDDLAALLVEELEEHAFRTDDGRLRAWCHRTRGLTAWLRADLEEADHQLEAAIDRYEEIGDRSMAADTAVQWASLCISRGHLRAASHAANRAEQLARGLDSLLRRQVVEVQAATLVEWGDFEAALEILTTLPDSHATRPAEVDVRLALLHGSILDEVGRLDDAATRHQQAVRLASHPVLRREVPQLYYEALTATGLSLGDRGETGRALEALEEARQGFQAAGDRRGVAWVAKNRGWTLSQAGRFHEALEAFRAGFDYGRREHVKFLEGWCALGMAEVSLDGGGALPDEWHEWKDTATRIGNELQDEHLLWRVASGEGRALERDGSLERAFGRYTEAVRQIERLRGRLALPGLLSHYLRNKVDPYQRAALAAARLGRFEHSFRLAELIRGRHLRDHRPSERRTPPLDPAECRDLAEAHARLRADCSPDQRRDLNRRIQELEQRFRERRLGRELVDPGRQAAVANGRGSEKLQDILRSLARHEVDTCLEYLVGERETLVFVLRADGMQTRRLPIGSREIAAQVQSLLEPIHALGRAEIDLAHLDFDVAAATWLYQQLVAPVASDLGTRVTVVPDGPLESLPFGMLVRGGRRGHRDAAHPFAELRTLRFLARDRVWSTLPAASCLVSMEEPDRWPPTGALAVFATEAGDSAGREWEHLPALAAGARGAATEVRLFPRIDRQTVLRESPGAAWLHFAAHGRARPDAPAHAALLLRDDDPEQRIESWEVESLELDADLVVLAACDSATGRSLPGEGTLSLTRSFLMAGARQVLASHWPVDDRATAAFMTEVYRHLFDGVDPATAVSLTQRRMIDQDDERGLALAHPYFWAAWSCHRGGHDHATHPVEPDPESPSAVGPAPDQD